MGKQYYREMPSGVKSSLNDTSRTMTREGEASEGQRGTEGALNTAGWTGGPSSDVPVKAKKPVQVEKKKGRNKA